MIRIKADLTIYSWSLLLVLRGSCVVTGNSRDDQKANNVPDKTIMLADVHTYSANHFIVIVPLNRLCFITWLLSIYCRDQIVVRWPSNMVASNILFISQGSVINQHAIRDRKVSITSNVMRVVALIMWLSNKIIKSDIRKNRILIRIIPKIGIKNSSAIMQIYSFRISFIARLILKSEADKKILSFHSRLK